jgi:hypothetical protein
MNRFWILMLAVSIYGCATPRANYMPVTQAISEPPLNSVNVVAVGDTMLRQGEFTEHEAILVPQQIGAGLYTIQPGHYIKTGEDDSIEFFYPGGPQPGMVEKPALADNWSKVIVKRGSPPQICVLTVYNTAITTCNSGETLFQRVKVPSLHRDSFQQTLLYSGKVGNKINIGYREFSNSLARPAFNNNVEYDLSESKTIAYKGAQLEVLEATNQHIKFRLNKNFNSAVR